MKKTIDNKTTEHFLSVLSQNYKQLLFPIKLNIKNSKTYKNAVYGFYSIDEIYEFAKLENIKLKLDFSFSKNDWNKIYKTPAGNINVLYFYEREDFVHAVNAFGNYCQPKNYPLSMKSVCISGIYDWPKINNYLDNCAIKFLGKEEVKNNIKNYLTSLIIVGHGPYSNVSASTLHFDENYWLDKSLSIRIYHELCHFTRNTLNISSDDQIFEEILADACGLIFAFGEYNSQLAKTFLGTQEEEYKSGGRLENYVDNKTKIQDAAIAANNYIENLTDCFTSVTSMRDRCWDIVTSLQTVP